jgi:hypothetical protein
MPVASTVVSLLKNAPSAQGATAAAQPIAAEVLNKFLRFTSTWGEYPLFSEQSIDALLRPSVDWLHFSPFAALLY